MEAPTEVPARLTPAVNTCDYDPSIARDGELIEYPEQLQYVLEMPIRVVHSDPLAVLDCGDPDRVGKEPQSLGATEGHAGHVYEDVARHCVRDRRRGLLDLLTARQVDLARELYPDGAVVVRPANGSVRGAR